MVFIYQWMILGSYKDELRFTLELLGVNPKAKTIEEMIETITGDNQFDVMTQLIALT